MTDAPAPRRSVPPEDAAQLRQQAAEAAARLRELIEQARELQAQAASLLAKNRVLRDEVRFCRIARHKRVLFP
jgi:uncharacterized coiled-coil DUF342 family protein